MKERVTKETLRSLSPLALQQALTGVTIGGASAGLVDTGQKADVFKEYARRAFPGTEVLSVAPIDTTAALNSVSGLITLQFKDQQPKTLFGKVHIESNTRSINPLGAEQEYAKAEMLAEAGWPVVEPVQKSLESDYPLLLYPVVKAPALFDILEQSHTSGEVLLEERQIQSLDAYNQRVGDKEVAQVRPGTPTEAFNAPVQTLFLRRFEPGGRLDQWYTSNTTFSLPGLISPLTWNELLDIRWQINDREYGATLRQIIASARKALAFEGETQAYLTVSHGDDHAGNIRLSDPPLVFDPAFAGWNPASLDLKALAHTGFLPLAAMYYPPKGLQCVYELDGDKLVVTTNIQSLPLYQTHEKLAKQLINTRLVPLLRAIRQKGGDLAKEEERVRTGLAGCALLTVDIAKLLAENDGRAVGLLPMAIMFYELSGLPALDYLGQAMKELRKEGQA